MFKLNDETTTVSGFSARIICVDSPYVHGTVKRPVVALIKTAAAAAAGGVMAVFYDEKGLTNSSGVAGYNLLSNEPTEAEAILIREVRSLVADPDARDSDERMLKVIRKLRSK